MFGLGCFGGEGYFATETETEQGAKLKLVNYWCEI